MILFVFPVYANVAHVKTFDCVHIIIYIYIYIIIYYIPGTDTGIQTQEREQQDILINCGCMYVVV